MIIGSTNFTKAYLCKWGYSYTYLFIGDYQYECLECEQWLPNLRRHQVGIFHKKQRMEIQSPNVLRVWGATFQLVGTTISDSYWLQAFGVRRDRASTLVKQPIWDNLQYANSLILSFLREENFGSHSGNAASLGQLRIRKSFRVFKATCNHWGKAVVCSKLEIFALWSDSRTTLPCVLANSNCSQWLMTKCSKESRCCIPSGRANDSSHSRMQCVYNETRFGSHSGNATILSHLEINKHIRGWVW